MMDRDELVALAGSLEAWSGFIASGYECPAAGQVMLQASRALREIGDENARLREIIYLYVDPSDVRPEHEEVVLANAARSALSPNPDQQED